MNIDFIDENEFTKWPNDLEVITNMFKNPEFVSEIIGNSFITE